MRSQAEIEARLAECNDALTREGSPLYRSYVLAEQQALQWVLGQIERTGGPGALNQPGAANPP